MLQGRKLVTVNAAEFLIRFPLDDIKCFIFSFYRSGNEPSAALSSAFRIQRKLGNERVLMRMEYLNISGHLMLKYLYKIKEYISVNYNVIPITFNGVF